MSFEEKSNIILIDADSFDASPNAPEKAMHNAFLVEFCIRAIENGYQVSILYNNQKRDISAQHARNTAIRGINQGVLAHNNVSRQPPTNSNFLAERLVPYSEYHAPDKNPSGIEKLDDAAMVVSPYPQATYQMLVGDFQLFVPAAEISDFRAFTLLEKKLNSDSNKHPQHVREGDFHATAYMNLILNQITITNALQDVIESEEAKHFLQDPRLTSFSSGEPKNLQLTEKSPPLSNNEFLLQHYFASLVRFQACPNRADEAKKDAQNTLKALSKVKGGKEAAQAIEEFVHKNVNHRPSNL